MRCVATSEPSVSRTAARCLLAIALLMSAAAGPRATAAEPAAASPLVARAGGVTARICRWRDDKPAAFSLRFDDSRDSQLEIALPLLDQHRLTGTFLINPGTNRYRARRAEWEKAAIAGGHELGNHSMNHRGAKDDADADFEIGECSRYIWSVFPQKSRLLAFRRGGGTGWKIQRPWSHYHEKYHLIQDANQDSVGTDPGVCEITTTDAFQRRTDQIIAAGGWLSFYFHDVNVAQGMSIGEKPFREMIAHLGQKSRAWQAWVGGIAQVHKYETERDLATIAAELVAPLRVKITVDCAADARLYDEPLTVRVDLPRDTWPVDDCHVVDADGKPIAALRREGRATWPQLMIQVPPRHGVYFAQVAEALRDRPRPVRPVESERGAADPVTGLQAALCRWHDGRKAAVSFQFDDGRADHLTVVPQLLREYGLKGTFLINPGRPGFPLQARQWAALAADHELGNHTFTHRGAVGDEAAETEVGAAAQAIWRLQPGRSKLLAFCNAGGTIWTFSAPWSQFLEKYHVLESPMLLSMADVYGDIVTRYRETLARMVADGGWMRSHYHSVGPGGLNISEASLRAAFEMTKQGVACGDLWNAGMAEIRKYADEREQSRLTLAESGPGAAVLRVSCGTNPELYDQPLTVELTPPAARPAAKLRVTDARRNAVPLRAGKSGDVAVLRFEVPPRDAVYSIERTP